MAEEQKPVVDIPEAAKQETPALEQAVAPEAVAAADKTADESKPADATDAADAAKTDDKRDEIKPIEEGHLGHKAQGASFPKNLIPSREYFFFGSDAVEPKALFHYQKSEKSAETAHDNIAWASHTGKGLLFIGDKKAPTGIINLAHASEPEVDGPNKFHFSAKGNKHSFKAGSPVERDSWVSQLKLRIAEAKELAATIVETDSYKKTLETLKPAAVVAAAKDDKPAADEAAKTEEPAAKADEATKDGEAAKEEPKEEEPKRRSASRKRTSFFGFGGKKEEKREERKSEEVVAAEPVAEAEAAPVADAAAVSTAEDKATEEATPAESPREKPAAPSKRNSFFGGVFSKKEKKPVEATKATEEGPESPKATEAVPATDATAPVIPPVESTTPLAVDVSSPATVPTENVDASATNGEAKKDLKEKRKSSLPFAFGKRDKSPVPAEGEEKSGKSAFSKLRATIKGKSATKAEEKPVEEAAKEEATAAESAKEAAAETAAKEEASTQAPKAVEPEAENKPENVATAAPAVTAAA
ncbi:hypothetical protein CDD83_4396 [Cordyceps sp. RAO-2017]|nr:hypothetical protein CDD83_4396 [Cordyceps sp. RAO-2017]